jgi:predicted nucleic acid-binding protein
LSFVLDASTALAWCFRDEGGDRATQVLEGLQEGEDVVPKILTLEIANGLLTAERRGRLDAANAGEAMALLLSLPIVVEPAERSRDFNATWRLARTHGLSAYDAAYLELAIRLRLPLMTLDERLGTAAEKEGLPSGF